LPPSFLLSSPLYPLSLHSLSLSLSSLSLSSPLSLTCSFLLF
jgi:hypothetical protein